MNVRAWVGLASAAVFVLLGAEARAECDPGYYSCGASYCAPSGTVCCASAGHPEKNCPSGTTCTSDGKCSSGGGGGGGGTCDPGEYTCGSGCMPSGAACCASLGYDGYCDPGESCTSDGKCSSGGGGGGTCPAGYPIDCGGDFCCPSGTTCTADGCQSGGGSSSGGTCPAGYPIDCGGDFCCPSGTTCTATGCRSSGGETTGGGSSGSATCTDAAPVGNCSSMKACADTDRNWYVVDGQTFQCSNHDCYDAAQDVADYCTNGGGSYGDSSDDDDGLGPCSVADPAGPGRQGGARGAYALAVAAGLALSRQLWRRRRP